MGLRPVSPLRRPGLLAACAATVAVLLSGCLVVDPASPSAAPPPADRDVSLRDILEGLVSRAKPEQAPDRGNNPNRTVTDFQNFEESVFIEVDAFWRDSFARAGRSGDFESPGRVWVPPGRFARSNCVDAVTTDTSPFYCPGSEVGVRQDTIYAGTAWMYNNVYAAHPRVADFAVAVVIAHEYGHHFQRLIGALGPSGRPCCNLRTINTELHADCLAGIWANSAYSKGELNEGDYEEGVQAMRDAADPIGTRPTDVGAHGNEQQRVGAFRTGFENGSTRACSQFLSATFR